MAAFGRDVLRILDERDPFGGRLKGLLFLVHPGPSLLVASVAVAGVRIVAPCVGAGRLALVGVTMLLGQFAIGVFNDVGDLAADRAQQQYKPLARSMLAARDALVIGVVLAATSVVLAAAGGLPLLDTTLAGLMAGIAYDLGLKRGMLSWLPWWGGLVALPLFVDAGAGDVPRFPAITACLALPLAVGLHCANALPDVAGDRAAGLRSLPAVLGGVRAWLVARAAIALTVVGVVAGWVLAGIKPSGTAVAVFAAGSLVLAVAMARPGDLGRPTGPLTAGTALIALAWFVALPG